MKKKEAAPTLGEVSFNRAADQILKKIGQEVSDVGWQENILFSPSAKMIVLTNE